MKIAICVVCYNRPDSLKRVLSSLEKAYYDEPVTLIISIDKSKTTVVEEFADQYKWEHGELRVIKHDENLGLRKHILSVGDHLKEFDAIVVLEDDIYVAPSFYSYAKQCVEKYHDNPEIAGISLYNFPLNYQCKLPFMQTHTDSDVFLLKSAVSWGQVWMRDQWFAFKEWYAKHDEEFNILPHLPLAICAWPKSSWLKYHIKYCIEENKYFVYPFTSLTTCFCDLGTHAVKKQTHTQAVILDDIKNDFKLNPTISYDGFFEAEAIYKHLDLTEKDLCIDLFGQKKNRMNRRYWLTQELKPYKVVKSYALDFKPWEQNILRDLEGNEIFLYDTTIKATTPSNNHISINRDFFLYSTYIDIRSILKREIMEFLLNVKHALFGVKKNN